MKKAGLITLLFILIVAAILLSPLKIQDNQHWIFYDTSEKILFSEIPHYQTPTQNDRLEKILIAVEDKHFRSHIGIDFPALIRAAYYNFKNQEITSGASTITMQLARLLFLEKKTHDSWYKISQIFYALKLEAQFTKNEILEMYLSRVYFGNNATGIDSAAKIYFDKPTATLSTAEIATLIGIIPRPDTWNPVANNEIAIKNRNKILQILVEQKIITPPDYLLYSKQKIASRPIIPHEFHAPHFVLWAKKKLEKKLQNTSGEIHVYTTLNGEKYNKILHFIRDKIAQKEQIQISNMSVVAINIPDNKLEIMLGSQDFFDKKLDGEVNMTTASRETGSTLKPFLFSLALEKGMSPLSEINDERQSFLTDSGSYSPRNFEPTREHGSVRFREALTNSYNIAAVDLLEKIGSSNFQNVLADLNINIEKNQKNDLSTILGTEESSLLQLTNAYSVFPHHGKLYDVQFFTKITNSSQETLLSWTQFQEPPKSIFQESTSDWITHALSDSPARWWSFKQGNPLELPFETAAKTGTSQDFRDNYVIGFSTKKVVGVWVGNTDGTPMHTSSGIEGAGETWYTIMQMLHDESPQNFTYNSGRTESQVCRRPGEDIATCAEKFTEFLLRKEINAEPEIAADSHAFSISYPGNGDIFHPDSPILIDVRNVPDGETVRYFLDGQEVEKLIRFLPSGVHTISARTETLLDSIQVTIE